MERVVQVNKEEVASVQSQTEPGAGLVRDFTDHKSMNKQKYLLILLSFLVITAGAISGYLLSGTQASGGGRGTGINMIGNNKKDSKEIQVEVVDENVFPDSAEGLLVKGGIEGEGTHHLDRNLGPEKYVYLTSSVIDLDSFEGKKVKVWGQTISGQSAGWLMDVGKVELIE